MLLDIRNADAWVNQNKIFNGLNLQIEQGEKIAVLGPNGAGKSTLLKLITREIYPVVKENSYIRLYGSETINLWELRKKIGLLSQDLQADYTPYCTGLDVVLSGFFGSVGQHGHLQATDEQRTQALQTMKQLGIIQAESIMYQRLSTGQQRRLLLARALIHQPEALIFDEPSSGLDPGAAFALLKQMRNFCRPDHSLILVTHHLDEIIPEVQRVVLIKQGKIVADGDKARILTSTNISLLYDIPVIVSEQDNWYRIRPA
ncbi:ABC transporter ATP-binding protein [Oceanospirillum sediminis]|uniref:ATP-binding cassette domain-containing protein n=1 Tax=Oceanospirillum sediminis TaxID=2760088 RepID=A0A839IRD3_9GAMM|nr:ATP-binding cassette domain-containing protein [Oceanospirillum sediminis]MBB1487059.1 ATP-binding cassette domain-containing protein [Oceanospirillum sediminis]